MAGRALRTWCLGLAIGWGGPVACGPMIELSSDGDSTAGDGEPDPTTGAPTPPLPVTTSPGDGTTSSVDTGDSGEFDTSEMWMDLPEDCSFFVQDCPPGYKCMPTSTNGGYWNDTHCVPVVEDPNLPGEPCTVEGNGTLGIDDCDITSMCWNVDPKTGEGICVAHCIGDEADPHCLDPCEHCTVAGDGILALCLSTCDPIIQNCEPGAACYPINDTFTCAPDASPRGTGVGSPCEYINVCPPGMFCLSGESVPGCTDPGCCTPACAVGGADPCPGLLPGSMCTPWYEEGPPKDEGLCLSAEPGVCVAM